MPADLDDSDDEIDDFVLFADIQRCEILVF